MAAASSVSKSLLYLGHRQASRQYSSFVTTFDAYQMQPLPNERAMQLARELHPGAEENLLHFILEESRCIPGLITIRVTTKSTFKSKVKNVLDREFLYIAEAINKAGTQRRSMYLLLAVKHQLPFTIYGFTIEDVLSELLLKCHILFVNGTTISSYYNDLRNLQQAIKFPIAGNSSTRDGGFSDNETSLGFCYEFEVISILLKLEIAYNPIFPLNFEYPSTDLTLALDFCSPERYDLSNQGHTVQLNRLYMLAKRSTALDFFAIAYTPAESFLVLVQVSIQKTQNKTKLKSSLSSISPLLFLKCADQVQPPEKIIYLYANPNIDINFKEALDTAKEFASLSCNWLRRHSKKILFWIYCIQIFQKSKINSRRKCQEKHHGHLKLVTNHSQKISMVPNGFRWLSVRSLALSPTTLIPVMDSHFVVMWTI